MKELKTMADINEFPFCCGVAVHVNFPFSAEYEKDGTWKEGDDIFKTFKAYLHDRTCSNLAFNMAILNSRQYPKLCRAFEAEGYRLVAKGLNGIMPYSNVCYLMVKSYTVPKGRK